MNIPLLRQIQAQIVQHPETFYMPNWDCDTAACIAGWACRLNGKQKIGTWREPEISTAQDLLNITVKQRCLLFLEQAWPEKFRTKNELAGSKARAKAACARIDHFISTGGEE